MIPRLDDLTPGTPQSRVNGSAKRKSNFETPSGPKVVRTEGSGTPTGIKTPSTNANGLQYVTIDGKLALKAKHFSKEHCVRRTTKSRSSYRNTQRSLRPTQNAHGAISRTSDTTNSKH
jgi:hypothetical protein